MDLLNLGSQSRKTGIRPRLNLRRDEYDMEDIDDFFEDSESDDDLDISGGSKGGRSGRGGDGKRKSLGKQRKDIVARKINFTEDETDTFDLSPISINKEKEKEKQKEKEKEKEKEREKEKEKEKEKRKQNESKSGQLFVSDDEFDEELRFDDFGDDMNDIPEHDHEPQQNYDDEDDNPQLISPSNKSISNLTKNMALGKTKKRSKPKSMKTPNNSITKTIKPSPLPSPPPDGLRRSKRTRITPLAYWRNERIVYSRADEFDNNDPDMTIIEDIHKIPLQEIKEVIHVQPINDPMPKRRKKRTNNDKDKEGDNESGSSNKRSMRLKTPDYDYESDPEVIGSEWFKNKSLKLPVYNDQESEETENKVIAYTADFDNLIDPPSSDIDNYKIAPLFKNQSTPGISSSEAKETLASAILEFPVEGFKSSKSSGNCIYLFHVIKGLVEINLSNNMFAVTRGCSFMVPSGNTYSITNIGNSNAKIFCIQVLQNDNE